MDLTEQAIEKLLATGRGQQELTKPQDGDAYFITPAGEVVDVAEQYPPAYIKQTVTLTDAKSFIAYVNMFKLNDEAADPMIFANVTEKEAVFTAILDYHGTFIEDGGPFPQRCAHRAVFTTKATPEWEAWQAANRKPMSQVDFATWIEDNMALFVQPKDPDTGEPISGVPSGAELLELVRSLHGHQNARFNTHLRLDNGAYSVAYEEEVQVSGTLVNKPGSLTLPPMIMGGFAVFEGASGYQVPARLKTRVSERRLSLWFETIALHKIVRESVDAIVAQVAEATMIKPLLGTPS